MRVYKPLRDQLEAAICINGKDVGYFKAFSETIDNMPIDRPVVDSKIIPKEMSGKTVSGRFDRYHAAVLYPDLLAVALGERVLLNDTDFAVNIIPKRTISKVDDFNTRLSIEALPANDTIATEAEIINAQSFIARAASSKLILSVGIGDVRRNPGMRIQIRKDAAGEPTGALIGEIEIPLSFLADKNKWKTAEISLSESLIIGNTYWFRVSFYFISGNDSFDLGYSLSDIFEDGYMKRSEDDGKTWESFTDWDIAFHLTFMLPTAMEFKVRSGNGTNKEVITFKKLKLSNIEFTYEPNALVLDTGTWTAEEVRVEAT